MSSVFASFAKVPVSRARNVCLPLSDRFNMDSGLLEQFIKSSAGNWIVTSVNHSPNLNERCG